jgi:hypothetical protein
VNLGGEQGEFGSHRVCMRRVGAGCPTCGGIQGAQYTSAFEIPCAPSLRAHSRARVAPALYRGRSAVRGSILVRAAAAETERAPRGALSSSS